MAEKAIRAAALTKDNPADLINVALEELVRSSCELPGYTTLDAMTTSIRTEVNSGFFSTVANRIPITDRARMARLLLVDPVARRSEFDRLKTPAKAASLGKFCGFCPNPSCGSRSRRSRTGWRRSTGSPRG
ncbi:DUF4158 domain-containing protein [Nocardia sp. GCM10030253]|uniref:DUF4158 domain-containing protein n=1 Tax=Nocardia sp. GCM10030253 TaxID=3273404 RepID=UPI00362B0130